MIRAMYDSHRCIRWFAQDVSRKNGDDSRNDDDDSHKLYTLGEVGRVCVCVWSVLKAVVFEAYILAGVSRNTALAVISH